MFGRWLGSAQNGTGNFGCSGDREFSEHSRALHSRVRGCHALKYPNGPQAAGPQVLCDLCHRPCRKGLCNLCPLSQVVCTIGRPLLVSPEVNFRYFETINNGFWSCQDQELLNQSDIYIELVIMHCVHLFYLLVLI